MPPFIKFPKTEAAAVAQGLASMTPFQREEIARSARQEIAEIWASCRRKDPGPGCGPGSCCGQALGGFKVG
jgi:hypothetical protein